MTVLRSVDPDSEPNAPEASGLPDFEGQRVNCARLKLSSVNDLETPDHPNHIDDIVKLFVEGRVVRVDHVVDEKTGFIKRVHTIKVVDAIQLPWGFDTGVFDA